MPPKIRTDYIPRAKLIQAALNKQKQNNSEVKSLAVLKRPVIKQRCPQCKQEIPVDELEKHIRIELMDPKWKQQKDREQAKKRESNLELDDGDLIAAKIKNFAQVRTDIFGGDEFEVRRRIEEQKRNADTARKGAVAWDGFSESINKATRLAYASSNLNVRQLEEQVEEQQRKKFGPAPAPPNLDSKFTSVTSDATSPSRETKRPKLD